MSRLHRNEFGAEIAMRCGLGAGSPVIGSGAWRIVFVWTQIVKNRLKAVPAASILSTLVRLDAVGRNQALRGKPGFSTVRSSHAAQQ